VGCPKLTASSIVLPEELIGLQIFKKFPAFYESQEFVPVITKALHLSLS
jgi:hypothetical protein